MNKKPRLILTTIFAITLIILSSNLMLQSAHAQVTSPSATPQLQIRPNPTTDVSQQANQSFYTFMNQVAGINMTNYKVVSFHASTSQVRDFPKPQTCIAATISNAYGSLVIGMILIEGKVNFYDLGVLSGTLPGSSLDSSALMTASSAAINNYQTYFNVSYCSQFVGLFPQTVQSNSFTVKETDRSLRIQTSNDSASSQLRYITLDLEKSTNGINYPSQSIRATLSRTGIVTSFDDSLGLYTVETSNSVISKEQAISIATPYINAYAASSRRQVQTVNATFAYATGFNGGRDSFTVYPLWTVTAILNGSSSGLTDYYVAIWADNGQIQTKGVDSSFSSASANSSISTGSASGNGMIILGLIIAASSVLLIAFARSQAKNKRWTKKATLELVGITLMTVCLCSTALIHPVLAYPSSILVTGNDVTSYEYAVDRAIGNDIGNWSEESNYIVHDNYDSVAGTDVYAAANDQGCSGSIAFFIGHGAKYGDREMEGSELGTSGANLITDQNIIANVNNAGHQKFVMLWACELGDDPTCPNNMPRAWLGTSVFSSDGYASPDSTGRVLIGFHNEAPGLYNTQTQTSNQISVQQGGFELLYWFYYYALVQGLTINEALDASVNCNWFVNFDSSVWNTNGLVGSQQQGTLCGPMHVYGDGYKTLTIPAASSMYIDAYGPESDELSNLGVYIDGIYNGTAPGYFTVPYGSYVTLEDPVYDYNLWCYVYFASRSTDGSTYYTAYYNYGYKK